MKLQAWNLNIDENEFYNVLGICERWIALNSVKKFGFCTYNEINILYERLNLYLKCVRPLILFVSIAILIYVTSLSLMFVAFRLSCTFHSDGK